MLQLLVATTLLWVIVAVVASKRGETSYSTLFYVSLGVAFVSFVVGLCQPELVIFVTPVICVLAIQKFCYLGRARSIVATVLYMAAITGLGFFLHSLMHSLNT